MNGQRVLILGGAGALGHVLLDCIHQRGVHDVRATVRTPDGPARLLPPALRDRIVTGVDADRIETVAGALKSFRPAVVVNCIGLIKQRPSAADPVAAISLNALFPHRLARLCGEAGARLLHISTDCVFDGARGSYSEDDAPDATDLYGRTKALGEVGDGDCLTLRTSFIGHELSAGYSLVEWFLSQPGPVRGFTRALYSGFPSVELARIIDEHVIPRPRLRGIYHLSSQAISKYELLRLVAGQYAKLIDIEPDEALSVDRSLDSSRFRKETGYEPPSWPAMIGRMHAHFESASYYRHRSI
jgi:dTDP-4-dehydrorhamnose reductase